MVPSLSYTIESSKLEKLETFKFLTSATEQHLKNIISPWKNIHTGLAKWLGGQSTHPEQAGEPESPEPSQRQGMVASPCHPRAKSKSPGTHRPASLAFAVWQTTKHFVSQKEKGGSQYPRLFSKRHSMYISTLAHMNYTQATLVYSDIHTTHKHMHTQISS